MSALTSRLSVAAASTEQAEASEDYFSSSLGVIFPDDVAIAHGDADQSLAYTSPHLPRPLLLRLHDPAATDDRLRFGHHVWNAALLLAELIEADSLAPHAHNSTRARAASVSFSVAGLSTLELGAGAGLPTVMAALVGASRAVATDYPAAAALDALRANLAHNTVPAASPLGIAAPTAVEGHAWGTPRASGDRYDRVLAADCLWMASAHVDLRASLRQCLAPGAQAWLAAGFHTGRGVVAAFLDAAALRCAGLQVEAVWERDCDGAEREWEPGRVDPDPKRWNVVIVLKRGEP